MGAAVQAPESSAAAAAALSGFFEPWIVHARSQLRETARGLCEGTTFWPFDPELAAAKLCAGLSLQLLLVAQRTLVLELNIARLQGRLSGATAEARFDYFVESLSNQTVREPLLREYPVMARAIETAAQHWMEASTAFLAHLGQDWTRLMEEFSSGEDAGDIVALLGGAGDLHKRGRSAILVKFNSGLKLAYKPHSLAVNRSFQSLLEWLNERGVSFPFETIRHKDCRDHGWAEFVSYRKCETAEDLRRFYRRQGGLLAILYALCATDMHSENLVASGEHPVIVDLETLFQPRWYFDRSADAAAFVRDVMTSSVAGIGLLPNTQEINGERIDRSGMGRAPGQRVPVISWERPGTDEMRLVETTAEMRTIKNRPVLEGHDLQVSEYAGEVAPGFVEVYQLFCSLREELLGESGPLASFKQDEIRVILRATRKYAELLNVSRHPDVQRDWREYSRLLDKLRTEGQYWPNITSAIPYERLDLEQGDIPFFTTRPDSKDIWTSTGECIRNFLTRTGYSLVEQRIRTMNAEDMRFQTGIIEMLMARAR